MKGLILIPFFMLYLEINSSDEFNILRIAKKDPASNDTFQSFRLRCITASINDAIVWNTDFNTNTITNYQFPDRGLRHEVTNLWHPTRHIDERRNCDINDRKHLYGCGFSFMDNKSDWTLTRHSEVPMGPIFDSHWERFEELKTILWASEYFQPVTTPKLGGINLKFGSSGALVVSVRGVSNAHFLICNGPDYRRDFCYWIIIGGWKNTLSIIRKCMNGVSFPPNDSECASQRSKLEHHPLSINEWKTFMITWNDLTRTIKLYDPDVKILSYTDSDSKHDNFSSYHVFFGNPSNDDTTGFRFHEYEYALTTKLEAQYDSYNHRMDTSNGRICVDMMVGLCATCELHVRLVDSTDNKELTREIISGLATSQQVQHGLPMWQHVQIIASNINETRLFARLEITTKSTDPLASFHWAIGDVQQCSAKGTIKHLYLEINRDIRDGIYVWPNVSCQRLSYDKQHAQAINPIMNVTSPPDNVTSCQEHFVGPGCGIPCYSLTDERCKGVAICNANQCYCSQGYTSNDCSQECAEEAGEFGYDCRKICDNCRGRDCSIYTGRCKKGCKKLEGEYRYVPPFCKDTVKIPVLHFDQIDSENLRIYFQEVDHDKKFNITYSFELEGNDDSRRQRYVDGIDDNGTKPIYFTVFDKLNPGMKYRARISQRIEYEQFGWIEETLLVGDFSRQWTMCMWNFTIERGHNNLTIRRIDPEAFFPCPDDYYSIKVRQTLSSLDESQSIDVTSINVTFPMTVVNLIPDTNYIIFITGLTSSFQRRREVRTLPSQSFPDRELKIDSVASREVSFSWLPPEETNGTTDGYLVTIKALRHEGCANDTSVNFMNSQSYSINNSTKSYIIRDLIPYVRYELTILAHHTRKEVTRSIEFSTKATEIPTAVYKNVTFANGKIKWTTRVADCSTITGPLHATRLFFFGVSENVKNFTDRYDSKWHSFTLNDMKKPDIHGCEQYRVRIHALRRVDGIHNETAYNELIFTSDPYSPDPPGKIFTTKIERGIVDLIWEHPRNFGGPVKEFIIHAKLNSTRLRRQLRIVDHNNIILYRITSIQKLYTTQLKLLPSTNYMINIRGIVVCAQYTLIGNSSSVEIEVPSSFAWYEDEPSCIVNNNNYSITLFLPCITHETLNSKMHIVLIGRALCENSPILNESLTNDIELKKNEMAWHINSFSTPPPKISIGGDENNNNIMKCTLLANISYVIVIVVRDDDIDESKRSKPFVWRSKSMLIIPRIRYEIWAVPLLLLIIIILVGAIWFLKRKKKRHATIKKNGCEYKAQTCSPHELHLTPISEERYTESKCETIVKLDKFQDYVKCAIASGKLELQYSRLSSSRLKSWEDGLLSEHASGDKDGITIANETEVTLKGHPNTPYFKCLNAHYINGYKKHKAYIVLQGPQSSTAINFWCMVWQERVEVICLLSDIVDDDEMRTEQYWPELGQTIHFGNIRVGNISRAPFADYTFSTFEVKCNKEIRKINHLHYTAWPDYGVPLYTQSVVAYLKKFLAIPSSTGPIIIHCNAGVGRTGVIILFDICHRRAVAEGVLDVYGVTDEIKRQRANMVDNKQQYIFAHVALVECLLSLSTAIPCDDSLPIKIQEHKYQMALQQEYLEQSVLQDKAIQFSTRSQLQLSEKNIAKNRFTDSLPMTRLYIPRYPTSDDDSSYISGVYVDSARRRNSYIASQLPMPTTLTDFWRMIASFKVELIIILQQPDIKDPTCCNFMPEPDEKIRPLPFLNINGKSVIDGEHFIQQKIVLKDKSTGSPREQTITILICKGWNSGRDKPPPIPATLVNLWQMAESISRRDESTVVLCHDGIHGCGLYLALSLLLERMGLEHECDVCFAIRAIRRSRFNFCRTKEQFRYLYDAALLYAANFDAYANFK